MGQDRTDIERIRSEIDSIDRQIAELLEKRFRRTDDIGRRKAEAGLPVFDPSREDAVLSSLASLVSPDVQEDLTALYRLMFARSRARQTELRSSGTQPGDPRPSLLVLNGPNLDMLGIREPELYGEEDYPALVRFIERAAEEEQVSVYCVQSNSESELIMRIHTSLGRFDGIVFNPAGYTHTSIALLDALKAVRLPCVEVHLTDISAREPYRRVSFIREACLTCISGDGFEGYRRAIQYLKKYFEKRS